MHIRLAKPSDKTAVLKLLDELNCELNKHYGNYYKEKHTQTVGGEMFEYCLKQENIAVFVAEEHDTIIASAILQIIPNVRRGEFRGYLDCISVHPSYRGKGIGSKLLTHIKEYCRDNHIKAITISSGLKLEDAHRFYEKNGATFYAKTFKLITD